MKMLNMFVAGFTAGAIIDSIYKNNSPWWTLWLIALMIFNLYFAFRKEDKTKAKRDTERFGYCKSPTYPRPPRPGYQGTRTPKHSTADAIRNVKPPRT